MQTIYLLNGPSKCGKDTVANIIVRMMNDGTRHMKFARCLKAATVALLNELTKHSDYPSKEVSYLDLVENRKDEHLRECFMAKPRDLLIAVSEDLCKKMFGKGFFGHRLAEEILMDGTSAVVSDCGFLDEIIGLLDGMKADTFWTKQIRFALVNIVRPGTSFAGDSRGWVSGIPGVQQYTVINEGNLANLRVEVARLLMEIEDNDRIVHQSGPQEDAD